MLQRACIEWSSNDVVVMPRHSRPIDKPRLEAEVCRSPLFNLNIKYTLDSLHVLHPTMQ